LKASGPFTPNRFCLVCPLKSRDSRRPEERRKNNFLWDGSPDFSVPISKSPGGYSSVAPKSPVTLIPNTT
jgi:hypothetical protein